MKIGRIQNCIIWYKNIIYNIQVQCALQEVFLFLKENYRNRITLQGGRVFISVLQDVFLSKNTSHLQTF